MGGSLGNPYLSFWSNVRRWGHLFFWSQTCNLNQETRKTPNTVMNGRCHSAMGRTMGHSKLLKGSIRGPSWVAKLCKCERDFPFSQEKLEFWFLIWNWYFKRSLVHSQLFPNPEAPESDVACFSPIYHLPSVASLLEYLHHKNRQVLATALLNFPLR